MSQFGGGKPPGQWGRPAPPGGAPQLTGFPTVNVGAFPMVGMGGMSGMGVPMGMVNQAAFSSPSMLGMQGMQGIMGAVPQQSLAQQSAVRAQPVQQVSNNGLQQNASGAKNQRTFVGVVTKMLDTYGFVDDDVFFQHSVIRGSHPKVGDKVMVEANYNPAMPFKWNAYRIQLLNATAQAQQEPLRQSAPSYQNNQQSRSGNDSSRWGSNNQDRSNGRDSPAHRSAPRRHSPPRRSPPRRASSPKRDSTSNRTRESRDTRRSPPRRSPPRRSSPPPARPERNERKRERSPSGSIAPSVRRDSASPPRRRARIIPRYECRLPKSVLLSDVISGSTLRHRYSKLYLPSDYVDLSYDWVRNVQLDLQLDLNNPVQFHVFHKDVEMPMAEGESLPELEPEDSDHRHQVKVLLLSHAGKMDVVKKAFCLLADGSTDDHQEPQSLWKNLSFLVGVRGKETMGIGGCWSPSLDGPDPTSPATMIKTAIRTTRALTGIDLSSVSQWFSMVQVRYYRADKQRVDHVNMLFPDTQQLTVSDEQWASSEAALLEQLKVKLDAIDALKIEEEVVESVVEQVDEVSGEEDVKMDTTTPVKVEDVEEEKEEPNDVSMTSENGEEKAAEAIENGEEKKAEGPTNWSKLDAKSMKVAELRVELESRGLETKGIKTLLVQRLQTALDAEKVAEAKDVEMKEAAENEAKTEGAEENPAAFIAPAVEETRAKTEAEAKKEAEEADKKKKKEDALEKEKKEKRDQLDKSYQLPKEKKILVYPSKSYKSGKFDCKIMTLSALLDYRTDDNKESQFEISLFAESFREMLERNAAFTVYETLVNCGDKEVEKKRREEARERIVEPATAVETPAAPVKSEEGVTTNGVVTEKKEEKPTIEKVELKSVVANRTVYEAFSLFDVNLCGYLSEKDVEEILYNGEFGISRGQIQKLAKKLSVRDKINYRHLTDVLTDLDGNVRHTPGGADDVVETDDLMKGYGKHLAQTLKSNNVESNGVQASSDGLVVINGNAVNVPQKLKQLKQAEQERDAAKAALNEQTSLIEQLREAKGEIDKKKKDIESHYHKANKRLNETSSQLKTVQEEYSTLKNALLDCKRHADRIFGVVEKALPPPPKKEEKKEKEKSGEKSEKKEEKAAEKEATMSTEDVTEIVLAEEVGEDEEKKEGEENVEEQQTSAQA